MMRPLVSYVAPYESKVVVMSRTLLLWLSLLSVSCCKSGPGQSAAMTAPQPRPWGGRVIAAIELVERSPDKTRFRWRITNGMPRPIWVPVRWGMSEATVRPLPFPMVAPPGDLMFVFADFVTSAAGRGTIIENPEDLVETIEMDADSELAGDVTLPLPYDPREGERDRAVLNSPYTQDHPTRIVAEPERALTKVGAVQLVVRYWDHNPEPPPVAPAKFPMTDPRFRMTAARAVVTGARHGWFDPESFAHYAFGERVACELPVKPGVKMYFTGDGR
jgi:hypothetical protein